MVENGGNDKCKIEDKEDKSDYEDAICNDPKILKSIKKYVIP